MWLIVVVMGGLNVVHQQQQHCAPVVSLGWAQALARCVQICLSCVVLRQTLPAFLSPLSVSWPPSLCQCPVWGSPLPLCGHFQCSHNWWLLHMQLCLAFLLITNSLTLEHKNIQSFDPAAIGISYAPKYVTFLRNNQILESWAICSILCLAGLALI